MDLLDFLGEREATLPLLKEYLLSNPKYYHNNRGQIPFTLVIADFRNIKQKDKFDSMAKLKLLILCLKHLEELNKLDTLMNGSSGYARINSTREKLVAAISKIYSRVISSKKYSKFNHQLNIEYTY